MVGLGVLEILILLILGILLIGIPVVVLVLVLYLVRRQGPGGVAELEAENRRLRERLDEPRGPA